MSEEIFDSQAALVTEQLSHTIDLLQADIERIRTVKEHADQLANHRLTSLERQVTDFEQRIRSLQESATQFKLLSSLATLHFTIRPPLLPTSASMTWFMISWRRCPRNIPPEKNLLRF